MERRDESKRPGPEPDRLKIEGDWKDALKEAIPLEKPPEGWPRGGDEDEGEGGDDSADD